jgi:heme a synthase
MDGSLVDFAPIARLAMMAALFALLPLSWVWLRKRGADTRGRLAATFDLVVFGSFTRLSDSGLGCPDWPGCYGKASPLGAHADIHAAQTAMPTGPVTFSKAWIEMIHRYLAMTVGVLILVMAAVSWFERRRLPHSPWWPTFTLVWVIVQGLFGKYTVTLKLYPAIVTLHLLGGLLLLALLAMQHEAFRDRALSLGGTTRRLAGATLGVLGVQIALGGWVSTNYAVLACTDFPMCNGQWLPPMDFANGFTVLRELGQTAAGTYLPMEALVAVHMAHRWFAVVAAAMVVWLALRLLRHSDATARRYGLGLTALLVAQLASGLSNVVLGWPLVAALAHSAGAAAFVLLLTSLLARTAARTSLANSSAGRPAWAA